jgi:hypothetical protein
MHKINDYEHISATLLSHICILREIGDFAFSYASSENIPMTDRRNLDRIGIRAHDLIAAITEFVIKQH